MKEEVADKLIGEFSKAIMEQLQLGGARGADVYRSLYRNLKREMESIDKIGVLIQQEWHEGKREDTLSTDFFLGSVAQAAALLRLMVTCLPAPTTMFVIEIDPEGQP